jgi:hypothetical protein
MTAASATETQPIIRPDYGCLRDQQTCQRALLANFEMDFWHLFPDEYKQAERVRLNDGPDKMRIKGTTHDTPDLQFRQVRRTVQVCY